MSVVNVSLSSYFAMVAVEFMDPECKKEWLHKADADVVPNMDAISKFFRYWKLELSKGMPPSAVPSTQSFTPATHSSSPSADSRTRHQHKPSPRRTQSGCAACGDSHSLSKCSTFQSYDLNKRNKFVRDKRLCINCLSDSRGCKNCPSKYSCRSCGGRHHTTLHKDKEQMSNSASANSAAVMTTNPSPALPKRQVKFLYTAVVLLNNGDRTVKARALLDGGAAISMILEKLTADLKLKRTHDPTSVNGIAGTAHCKFTVVTNILSVDESFKSDPIHFTVIPSLESIGTPDNREDILANPKLRPYNLADTDFGGQIDLVLGVEQTSDLTTDKPFHINRLSSIWTRQQFFTSSGRTDLRRRPPQVGQFRNYVQIYHREESQRTHQSGNQGTSTQGGQTSRRPDDPAQHLVRDTDLDSMMALLKEYFGSPQIVCPLIIKKIYSVNHFSLNLPDVTNVHNNFIVPFQKLRDLVVLRNIEFHQFVYLPS